ncbi:MAG: hypothetical protein AAGA17_21365 [Actinomycetota bacterium]
MDPEAHLLDLDPDDVVDEYRRRGLADVPDAELGAAAAAVIGRGHPGTPSSFLLHAPLELIARTTLLRLVDPAHRTAARQRIAWLAATHARAVGPQPLPDHRPTDDPASTAAMLARAVDAGELDDAGDLAGSLAAGTTADELVGLAADVVVPRLGAAGHGTIFLHLLRTYAAGSPRAAAMFAALARELARHPGLAVTWADGAGERSNHGDLDEALRSVPHLGPLESDFIAPTTGRVESAGLADDLLRPSVGSSTDIAQATRALLRVAAESMLVDDAAVAPYGWSHALTIPQAIAGVARTASDPAAAIGVAATHLAGFRASSGAADLRRPTAPPSTAPTVTELATNAAVHPDAHLAKYTLAAIEATRTDPSHRRLYLAAAGRLRDVWRERPIGADPILSPAPAAGS